MSAGMYMNKDSTRTCAGAYCTHITFLAHAHAVRCANCFSGGFTFKSAVGIESLMLNVWQHATAAQRANLVQQAALGLGDHVR